MPDERDVRREEERDRLLDRVGGHLDRGPGRRAAAVQDEDVDSAEGADRRLHEALEVLRDRQVALHRQRAEALGLLLEEVPPAGEHHDVGALGGEGLRDGETHARGGAADDRRPIREPEVHGGEGYPGGC